MSFKFNILIFNLITAKLIFADFEKKLALKTATSQKKVQQQKIRVILRKGVNDKWTCTISHVLSSQLPSLIIRSGRSASWEDLFKNKKSKDDQININDALLNDLSWNDSDYELKLKGGTLKFGTTTPFTIYLDLIKDENDIYTSQIELHSKNLNIPISQTQFLTNSYFIYKKSIFITKAEQSLLEFNDLAIPEYDLNKYLTIFANIFPHATINFANYQKIDGGEINANPAIAIEEVDEDKYLYLRMLNYIEDSDIANLLNPNLLSEIAVKINHSEKNIITYKIKYKNLDESINELNGIFKRIQKKLRKNSESTFINEGDLFMLPPEIVNEFIYDDLFVLLNKYLLLQSEKLKIYNVSFKKPTISLNIPSGIDFLNMETDLNMELDFDNEKISIIDAIKSYQEHSYILLSNNVKAIVDSDLMNKLSRIVNIKKNKSAISLFDLPELEQLNNTRISTKNKKYTFVREFFQGINTIQANNSIIPKLKSKLRDYQAYGYQWLEYLYKNNFGGCLADDMGLGKTIQAIAILTFAVKSAKKCSLVVVPKSLIFNWERELELNNAKLKVYRYYGSNRDLKQIDKNQICLTTYGTLTRDIAKLKDVSFDTVILDESQKIKTPTSNVSRSVCLLKSDHRFALSGTPIENNLYELFALFRFINPFMFQSQNDFKEKYMLPIETQHKHEVAQELKRKISPFILRRTKDQVLKDLPEKTEIIMYTEMDLQQKALYEERRLYYVNNIKHIISTNGLNKSKLFIFQALNELRQIASNPSNINKSITNSNKRDMLMEKILDCITNRHKVLIFTNYIETLISISADLTAKNINHLTMTGKTQDRQKLVDKFQNDLEINIFVSTIKAGGVGLNLTAADTVFIFDPWWNVSVENQAIDRTHRIGQHNKVFAYKLVTKDSIEEKIIELQNKKKNLIDSILDIDKNGMKFLNEDDINYLLN